VHRCCDTTGCDVNVQGPCVCASYGDPSPSQTGWNYSFLANCAQNSVTGTPLGTACTTFFNVEHAYSCYCRLREAGDIGNVGDKIPGNAIFDYNDQCVLFKGSVGTPTVTAPTGSTKTCVPTATTCSAATVSSSAPILVAFGLVFFLLLATHLL
jgi:hypothetical protein